MKGRMKKLLLGLSLIGLLAGCASTDNGNGMGGSSDQFNQTDQHDSSNSSDQFNNNATHGTGSSIAPNEATDEGMK
jgi:hypothetical protein